MSLKTPLRCAVIGSELLGILKRGKETADVTAFESPPSVHVVICERGVWANSAIYAGVAGKLPTYICRRRRRRCRGVVPRVVGQRSSE